MGREEHWKGGREEGGREEGRKKEGKRRVKENGGRGRQEERSSRVTGKGSPGGTQISVISRNLCITPRREGVSL